MSRSSRRGWGIGLGVAAAVGVGIRFNNALLYPLDMGFDAIGNWEYIALLLRDWTLPPPDTGWSTAHPPFFYNFAAAIVSIGDFTSKLAGVQAIRLATALCGVVGIAAAVHLVRRLDPGNARRACLAGGLIFFLPVHLYMSAMLSEEILVTTFISLALVGVALDLAATPSMSGDTSIDVSAFSGRSILRASTFGAIAGLALLTKLSGLLVVAVGSGAYLLHDLRRGSGIFGARHMWAFGLTASVFGGWYYLWNVYTYGYLYPHGLEVHSVMFRMPPGERELLDYLRFPLATFTDAQLLAPDLLRSVWGSTYVTIWFDGHRSFLPNSSPVVRQLGTAIGLLALVPTTAFLVGLVRGAKRLLRDLTGPDLVLLGLVFATLLGYIVFTWRNPWFAVLKGSFLLGLSVPFAFYASEVLADWTRGRSLRSASILACLGLLVVLSIGSFTYGLVFSKLEIPGVHWQPVEKPWQG